MKKQKMKITIEIDEEMELDDEYSIYELNEDLNLKMLPYLKELLCRELSLKEFNINLEGKYSVE